ncbi:MAG: hypothetical protein ABIK25_12050 [Pseudomonadota bacterium]
MPRFDFRANHGLLHGFRGKCDELLSPLRHFVFAEAHRLGAVAVDGASAWGFVP